MQSILELTLEDLKQKLLSWGFPAFSAGQILSWVYQKTITDFSLMTDLRLDLRKKMREEFYFPDLSPQTILKSKDGTEKFLFKLEDGNLIETVSIPTEKRLTGCISSQIGCKYGCGFCASASGGFVRNLTCGEILAEALNIKKHSHGKKLTHIVFMGTGEPFDNYENVLKAIRMLNAKEAFNIGARHITISSAGVIPGIRKLAKEKLQVELSISLHAAEDSLRSSLMPINKKYPLKELLRECKNYAEETNRQVTFEYILIDGVNSGLPNARKLVKMLAGFKLSKVNIIPANFIKDLQAAPPAEKEILLFKDYLAGQGVNVTLRKPRGQDIAAACGQLRSRYEEK